MPAITVLMPLYNSKPYVAEAIRSVLAQSFTDLELLIIDDSNDGSHDVAAGFNDPRIRIIKNDPPLGLRKSSNLGIREAKGKYIARMEADDRSSPNRLGVLYAWMEANPGVSVCGSYMQVFGNEDGVWKFPLTHEEIRAGLVWGITVAHPTSFFRRSFLTEGNYFYVDDGRPFAEDWEFFYNMRNGARFANLDQVLYFYRRSTGSVTKRMRPYREEIMTAMFSRILSEFGMRFTEEELLLHKFITTDFILKPDAGTVRKASAWIARLSDHNRKTGTYDRAAFDRMCEKQWLHLFHFLVPFGYPVVKAYFQSSDTIRFIHLAYYFKYTVNKWIGRNPH